MPVYARESVACLWLVNPAARTLEVYRLAEGRWVLLATTRAKRRFERSPSTRWSWSWPA
jgi:hypothetical protein